MTYNTGNPIGSSDPRDLRDNSENIDVMLNSTTETSHPDRIGTSRKTWHGMEVEFQDRMLGMAFTRVGTFSAGFTLTDSREVLLCETDGHEYGWTGAFPKVVPPVSTPAGTGGVGAGAWVDRTDVAFRSELGELESAVLIAGAKASGIISVNARRFGAHPITEIGYETFDSTQAFQDAIDYATANNIGTVEFDGQYLIDTALWNFETPGDDGTVYPAWVGAGDANLTAETTYQIPCCLKISSRVKLKARNKEKDSLIGSWDHSTVNLSQKALLLITAGSKYDGTIRYSLEDFTIVDFFIGRIVEGTSEASYEQIKFVGCGISGLIQGVERRFEGLMEYSGCFCGDVHGGWWTQRNSTRQDSAYIPPYPATDVYSIGWTDYCNTDQLIYGQYSGAFGAVHEAIDAFFDTYFYKTANSARTLLGGRLSNNDAPNPAITYPYLGIVGRARTVLSRYGRAVANYDIKRLKTIGTHRTPVFYGPGAGPYVLASKVHDAYIERSGLVNNTTTSTTSNEFGIDYTDPYRAPAYGIGYSTCYGPYLESFTLSTGVQQAPTHEGQGSLFGGGLVVSKIKYASTEVESPYFFDFTTFGDSFSRKYRAHEDWMFTQPLRFGSEAGENFTYTGGNTFTPTLNVNGTPVALGAAQGTYKLVGKIVVFNIAFFRSVPTTFDPGTVTIGNMPYSIGTSPLNGASISFNVANGLTAGITLAGRMSGTTITVYKDTAGTLLSGTELNGATSNTSISLSGWYFIN